jgi:hypothetical protein
MKLKLVITIALSAFTLSTIAQTEKGTFLLGGSISYASSTNKVEHTSDYSKSHAYTISPKMGYFIENNFAIGTKLQFSRNKNRYSTSVTVDQNGSQRLIDQGTETNTYGISPFARYYVNITEQLKFYAEFEMSFERAKAKRLSNDGDFLAPYFRYTIYRPALSPGLVLFPSKKWAIEFSFPLLSFESRDYTEALNGGQKANTNAFNFGLNTFTPQIGINYHF